MKILDAKTGLCIDIKMQDNSNQITSATFSGKHEVIASIARQLAFFEALTYDDGDMLCIERQNNKDGSITITTNITNALLFIARHDFLDLSQKTRTSLEQICLGNFTIPQESSTQKNNGNFLGEITQTLSHLFFHQKSIDPAKIALLQHGCNPGDCKEVFKEQVI